MSTAQSFVETMKKLIAREVAPLLPSWRWGQVVATEPVTIELDADQGTLSEIGSLVSGLAIGDRVQVLTWGTRSTITGIAGGGGFQKRVFPTLAAAEAADLPVGVSVFIEDTEQTFINTDLGYMRVLTTADDTGWVTSGLSIEMLTGWELVGYELRKRLSHVSGVLDVRRTGGTITPNDAGNFTDSNVCVMPAGWRNTRSNHQLMASETGVRTFFVRANTGGSGIISATHGIPGVAVVNAVYQIMISYPTD